MTAGVGSVISALGVTSRLKTVSDDLCMDNYESDERLEWSEVLSSGRLNAVDESIKSTSRLINRTIPKITKSAIGEKIQSKPVVPIKDQRMDAQNA